jgi:hypothetical protein
MGKKDIIKIDSPMEVDLDVLGYIDHNITVNIIRNGVPGGEKAPGAAGEAGERHPLQKSPLHHGGGAAAGRHLPALRPGDGAPTAAHTATRKSRDNCGNNWKGPGFCTKAAKSGTFF